MESKEGIIMINTLVHGIVDNFMKNEKGKT